MSQSTLTRTGRTVADDRERSTDEEIVVSLVREITEQRGETPMETSICLHEYVDPDGLNRLLSHARTAENAEWEFSCTVGESDVTISSDGSVTVV